VIDGNFKLYYTADATRGLIYVYVDGVYLGFHQPIQRHYQISEGLGQPNSGAGEHTLRFEHKTKKGQHRCHRSDRITILSLQLQT